MTGAFYCYSILPGLFAGFDESEPTSRSGGKTFVVGLVKQKHDT